MKRKTPLIALLLLALAAGAWVALRPPPAPPPVLIHPSSHQLAVTEQHFAGLGKAMTNPSPGPRTLRLSEDDLNVYLAGSKSVRKFLAAHGVQAVQIVFQEPDGVIVHATVRLQKHVQNIQVNGAVAPDAKTGLRFTATHAQIGRLPLPPQAVTAEANRLAARFTKQLLSRLAISVQSVTIQKKDLVLVGLPIRPSVKSQSVKKASQRSVSPDRH